MEKKPFILPTEEFYYAKDYYSYYESDDLFGAIYEVFSSESNERIYFIEVRFIRKGEYDWFLDYIYSTQEP